MDVRPFFTHVLGEVGTPILAGTDARVDAIAAHASDALETAHRLGVTELGTARRPLFLEVTDDLRAAGTPAFDDSDQLIVGSGPIGDRARQVLAQAGVHLPPGATWLDLDLRSAVGHEVGHGVVRELVPQMLAPEARIGAWRTAGFDRRISEELLADVFGAIHARDWNMTLHGAPVRDAANGVDFVASGGATVDMLNDVRAVARGGIDDARVGGIRDLDGSLPHTFAGLVTPAFAKVEQHAGWDAVERVYLDTLDRLAARAYPIDVPSTARETARAAAAELGPASDGAREIKRLLMTNGSMG